jgi:hypothetical protein
MWWNGYKKVPILSLPKPLPQPNSHGFGFFMFKIRIPIDNDSDHICEVQVHHAAIKELDISIGSHEYYEYFRVLYAGSDGDKTVSDRLDG